MPAAEEPETVPLGDLFAFANALAALAGGAVAVEDPRGSLLAYSNLDQPIDEARRQTILRRGNPPDWGQLLEDSGYTRLLATTDGPVRITDPTGAANERVATLVRAGGEVLGSLWVVAGDAPLPPEAEQVLRDAEPRAAMQLLRHREVHDGDRRQRSQALRRLLAGDEADLGLDPATTCQVVGFRLSGADDDVHLTTTRARVVDAVSLACEAFRRLVVCTWVDTTVYALLPDVSDATSERLVALAEEICRRSSSALDVHVTAGISAPHAGLSAVPACRAEADRVLRVLADRPGQLVATLDEVRIASVLVTLKELVRQREDLRTPGVQLLADHDAQHGKTYLDSLRAYLDSGCSIPAAAAALGVHANTMRYRVTRIREISGLDLDDPQHRLAASLELLALS